MELARLAEDGDRPDAEVHEQLRALAREGFAEKRPCDALERCQLVDLSHSEEACDGRQRGRLDGGADDDGRECDRQRPAKPATRSNDPPCVERGRDRIQRVRCRVQPLLERPVSHRAPRARRAISAAPA